MTAGTRATTLLGLVAIGIAWHAMPARAQSTAPDHHGPMDDSLAVDHGGMDTMHDDATASKLGHAQAMSGGRMQGGPAPAGARDPDAYADGLVAGPMPGMDMADDARHAYLLLDRLEVFNGRNTHGQALDGQGWIGGDLDKLWFKVDGDRTNGRLEATRTEAFWDHAVAAYWSTQAGVRHDLGGGPARTWAAFGVEGLAPYWFDVEATAYVGANGRSAVRFETEYDLRITQRVVLQPDVKLDAFGKDDRARAIGSGLSRLEAALRLRYEITRKVAPYVGVVFERRLGNTARLARDDGGAVSDVRGVAGVHLWF